jgi:hypothetical protein
MMANTLKRFRVSQPVAGVIGGSLNSVSIMVPNILKLFRVIQPVARVIGGSLSSV